ncbi:MAG: Glu-tRNA(Gln) amidotransferase subunit GatE [Candidatus Pacearchaeota archaeon]|nr:Glu-tRNA(Gln) amidotransferase subunit GatE [Candidatus Pacearchaeota archaeon]
MDYKKIGFKAGLEIHQQIDTGKLFSNAPSFLRNDEPDYVIRRRMHAVAGETGEVDVAVMHEAVLGKEFCYEGYCDSVSLVELDEEPPRPINEDALDIALQVALLLNCEIYYTTQVMRKTVIDGSNTSGFQRTVLIAHSGFVETSFGKVGVDSVCLEEDSARVILREKDKVVYRLDRLGIPLVEIATAPDMRNPEEVKEVALKLGEILRACKVKRGIGTIRQDVNVSIEGHDRVEIKGFQEPKMFVKTIDLEIERQLENIKKGNKIGEVRNALPSGETEYLRPMPGQARMYPETDLDLLKISRERVNKLKKHLPKLRTELTGLLKKKGLSDEMIKLVLSNGEVVDEFLALIKVYNKDANLVGKMITLWRTEFGTKMRKSMDDVRDVLSEKVLERILEKVNSGKLDKSDVKIIMEKILDGLELDDALRIEKAGENEIEERIRAMVKGKPGLRANAYMGLVMKEFKGKLDAKRAMEIVRKVLG